MQDTYTKAWLIPWAGGGIGIAYKWKSGSEGFRELLPDDKDLPVFRAMLSDEDRARLEEIYPLVVPFRRK